MNSVDITLVFEGGEASEETNKPVSKVIAVTAFNGADSTTAPHGTNSSSETNWYLNEGGRASQGVG